MLLFHGYAAITFKLFCLPYSYTLFLTNKTTKLILSNKAVRNNSDCLCKNPPCSDAKFGLFFKV